ncbi:pirin family protein [Pengzhenrongella frigida]|uniref:Pirin family protein n=1 Tax=Pengzhenrongella frigida TaxID=1259133 RepID=A0A4Q5N6N0_9MICO|nr:pirin family protein [Cellulomonas sp. HLT2-17]RYV51951.1 pirin family protein [Cellulomonas sp. HLT2-17]
MTNLEARPQENVCRAGPRGGDVELIEPRDVPLGGPRAMTVRRTLPSKQRSLVGPFCFLDHYGPNDIAVSGGMDVPPHPHAGLQTVTWLFDGQVLHRDSIGSVQTIAPGQLNLMTAGRGISHSEEGTLARFPGQRQLSGIQLWTALPDAHRHLAPTFEHVAQVPSVVLDGALVRVLLGELGGVSSPAHAYSPLVAAQLDLPAGAVVRVPVRAAFEHAVLLDLGELTVAGRPVPLGSLAYLAPGVEELVLEAGDRPARAVLIGGEPFDEQVLMWWNFVGRTHEEVVEARAQWQAAIAGADEGRRRFGAVVGYDGAPLPAPELPNVRLVPRRR